MVRVLQTLDAIARESGCPYFVAGATARDLVLVNVHGLRSGRATYDIDFGIAVADWSQFEALKERLIETGMFAPNRKALQRLIYRDSNEATPTLVDLIPFGGVASEAGTLEWPPSRDIVMNVAGFEDALASSLLIEIKEGVSIRVASIPGLALLKLIAWVDRSLESNKDARDLYRLLNSYADAGNSDRLYGPELKLLEEADFDLELAGAELLDRDVARASSRASRERLRVLLASERDRERLVNQMTQGTYAEALPNRVRLIQHFCKGFLRMN